MFRQPYLLVLALVAALVTPMPRAAADEAPAMLVTSINPAPESLPTLSVYQRGTELLVRAAFPNVPGFACDSWCYESEMDCVGIEAMEEGRIQLRHRDRKSPQTIYVTTAIPKPQSVEILVKAELAVGATGSLPDQLQAPNMCWQLKPANTFASSPDPYPDFVKRCFIFTDKGRTFLDKTERSLIPCRPATDKENNPPWVQMYVGNWQEVPEAPATSWAGYSSDRYAVSIIGAVSRDAKYLAALANDSANGMAQAWHDCMHNNAQWLPADVPPAEREWRVTMYVMENDPEALLERAAQDFPNLRSTHVSSK